jgi:hypothetical protein
MKHVSGPRRGRPRGNGKRFAPGKNHTFESNGPDVKIRGSAQQLHEKYLSLARDALSSGDRINAEGFFQFADHYYRIVSAANSGQSNGRSERPNRIPPPPESAAGRVAIDESEVVEASVQPRPEATDDQPSVNEPKSEEPSVSIPEPVDLSEVVREAMQGSEPETGVEPPPPEAAKGKGKRSSGSKPRGRRQTRRKSVDEVPVQAASDDPSGTAAEETPKTEPEIEAA